MRKTQLDSRSARRTIGVIIRDAAADPGCFDTALKMDEDFAPVRIFRVRYLRETTFGNNGLVESDCADGISTSGNQGCQPAEWSCHNRRLSKTYAHNGRDWIFVDLSVHTLCTRGHLTN